MDRTMADTIVNRIVNDLQDRRGLGGEWQSIDDEIRREIRESWRTIIEDTHAQLSAEYLW